MTNGSYNFGFIRCCQTGKVYKNAGVACRMLGINPSYMSRHLRGCRGFSNLNGFRFEYAPPYDKNGNLLYDIQEVLK